jgi:hypothetical protein
VDAIYRREEQAATPNWPKKATLAVFLPAFAGFSAESGENRGSKSRLSPPKGLATPP